MSNDPTLRVPDPRRGNPLLRWTTPDPVLQPCIGLLESDSVACGMEGLDRMAKTASVEVLLACPVSPGKWISLITGTVEDVTSSVDSAAELISDSVVDSLILPNVHPSVVPALRGEGRAETLDALGIVETFSVASCIVAADAAAKRAVVQLLEMGLANGLGGKSYFTLTGAPAEVRTAVATAAATARERNLLVREVVIPQVHPDLRRLFQ